MGYKAQAPEIEIEPRRSESEDAGWGFRPQPKIASIPAIKTIPRTRLDIIHFPFLG
jgi:hypothetical protein